MSTYWFEQTAEDIPEADDWLSPNELLRLAALQFPKRRSDWRLGRWTAKNAVVAYLKLANHAAVPQDLEIRAASSGAPEVFIDGELASVSISLSHCRGIAACTVAPSGTILGCDLEVIETRSHVFVGDYFTEPEKAYVARAPSTERDRLVTLLWSAKESALKAMRTGLRLETQAVSVHLGHDKWEASEPGPRLPFSESLSPSSRQKTNWAPMRVCHWDEQVFDGWWLCNGEIARTMVSIPSGEPPSVLEIEKVELA